MYDNYRIVTKYKIMTKKITVYNNEEYSHTNAIFTA